jgi:hypothetical protein
MSTAIIGSTKAAGRSLRAPDSDASVLVMPEGWVIDELSRERLARQLEQAPAHIRGVVAETGVLPQGSSYRVHSERLCMAPLSVAVDADRDGLHGAALLRSGVPFEIRDDGVAVDDTDLLVDPGAHVHDPWRRVAPPEDASPLGRPPFPRRPTVVLLACEPQVEALDWARSLVNNLIRRDVEGRLAMLEIAEGLHLTQPCLPSEESIRVLRPDVILALDQTALGRIPAWCDSDRRCVAVELIPDVVTTVELVSWQLGRAQGRIRARVGRRMDAPSLVSLVNRLCSGPHPAPPRDSSTSGPGNRSIGRSIGRSRANHLTPRSESLPSRSVLVVTTDANDADRHPLHGLVDHLLAAGHTARIAQFGSYKRETLRNADVVIIGADVDNADLVELIEARRLGGRPTVTYMDQSAITSTAGPVERDRKLATAGARLVRSSQCATTGSSAVLALLRTLDVRAHLLPPLIPRAEASELRSARRGHTRYSDPVIGWHVGTEGNPCPDYVAAVTDAVLAELEERSHARVEIVGDASHLPSGVVAHPRISVLRERPRGDAISRWAAHIWTPALVDGLVADDARSFVEVSGVGVPTVLPEPVLALIGGYPPPGLLVREFGRADEWIESIRSVLESESTRSRLSRAAIQRFDTMNGAAASAITVNRLLGWALYKHDTR